MLLEVTCPHCDAPATQMPVLSEISTVDFFQCTRCGKVSEREKAVTDHPVASAILPLKVRPSGPKGRHDPASR